MLRLPRRALFLAATVVVVPFACTSFGSDPGDAPDAQPSATASVPTVPTTSPGSPDADLPDGVAAEDAAVPPPRDAGGPLRACTGTELVATGFEGPTVPAPPFTGAGTLVPHVDTPAGFSNKAITYRLPMGTASMGMLTAEVPVPGTPTTLCFEATVKLTPGFPSSQGAEIDVLRVTSGGVTVRIGLSPSGPFLASSNPPSALPLAGVNWDRVYPWVVRLNGTNATFTLDGKTVLVPAVKTTSFSSLKVEVGVDATSLAAAAVPAASITFDDLHATSQ